MYCLRYHQFTCGKLFMWMSMKHQSDKSFTPQTKDMEIRE